MQAFQVFYWWAVWAALDGQTEKARSFLKMMKIEATADSELLKLLTADQRKTLSRISKLLQNGEQPRYLQKTEVSPVFHAVAIKNCPFETEKELQKCIFLDPSPLRAALVMPQLELHLCEFECIHGRMDILGKSGDLTIVVELKIREADHAVVTQLEKYMHTEYKRLHYGDRSDVLGVVIAPSYSAFAEQELKKLNVVALRCIMSQGKLALSPCFSTSS